MIKFFSKAAVAAVALVSMFTSCQKEVSFSSDSEQKAMLKVSIPTEETKVISGMDETRVQNYQVFLFMENGVLEDYVSQSSSDVLLECTMGKKTVVVLVNAPSMDHISDYNTLLEQTSRLSDNAVDAFVMEGKSVVDIRTTNAITITINVSRKVAKVQLSSLNVDIDMPQYNSLPFKVSSVYLVNVPAQMPYFNVDTPEVWYNKFAYSAEDDNTFIYDDMGGFEVTADTPYTTKNIFYCYPNNTEVDSYSSEWCARKTRLVVEATIGDKTYYYPVTLPNITPNKVYNVNLTVTRPGAETPDAKITKLDVGIEININDWESAKTINEEI